MHLRQFAVFLQIHRFQEMINSYEHVGEFYRLSVILGYVTRTPTEETEYAEYTEHLVRLWSIQFAPKIVKSVQCPECKSFILFQNIQSFPFQFFMTISPSWSITGRRWHRRWINSRMCK